MGAYTTEDFGRSPYIVFYETTRACDLICRHCRACAQPNRHSHELSTQQATDLFNELACFPKPPLLVLTGGDPLKRNDLYELIRAAKNAGLQVAMTPSATPLVTPQALHMLQEAGVSRLALSLDGVDAATHDDFRGVAGSYARTLGILEEARQLDFSLQVNTTITPHNVHQVDALAQMLASTDIVLWSVFFLVPVGRGLFEQRITPEQYEQVFERLWHHTNHQPYGIKTTEGHHYRRYVLQHHGDPQCDPIGRRGDRVQRAPLGINDGKGVMFISHTGQIFPSGFMPIECGRFPRDSVVRIYQDELMFRWLRNPALLEGKCGVCEFNAVCGGSRARAYAVTHNPLASDPDCLYRPKTWA